MMQTFFVDFCPPHVHIGFVLISEKFELCATSSPLTLTLILSVFNVDIAVAVGFVVVAVVAVAVAFAAFVGVN